MTKTNDNQVTQDAEIPSESTWRQRIVLPCGVTLYQGDCMDLLPHLEGIDAVATDPPYPVDIIGSKSRIKYAESYSDFDPTPFLKWDCLFWGASEFSDKLPKGSFLVWMKRAVECTQPKSYADGELAWTTINTPLKIIRHISDGCIRQGEEGGVPRIHPFQKPVRVMVESLSFFPEGATILDPYMGSGSTIIAAIRTGRKAIGIEKDPEHFETARKRIEFELAQGDLFRHNDEVICRAKVE